MKLFLPDSAEERLKQTFFLVETENDQDLWANYSPQSPSARWPVKSWKQVMDGHLITVGHLTTYHDAKDITVGSKVTINRQGITNGLEAEVKEWCEHLSKWRISFDEEYQGWYYPSELITKDEYHVRPINISLSWAWIDDQLVCFWYPCSQLVDHKMIEQWFDQNFHQTHDGGRRSRVDHQNFHNCIGAINNKNKELLDKQT